MSHRMIAVIAALGAMSCRAKVSFTCDQSHSCGSNLTCVSGSCALTDTSCPSGMRYHNSAAGGLAGQCVDAQMMLGDMAGLPDLLMSHPPDLYGADFAGDDLSSIPDLSTIDMTVFVDMSVCTPTGAEDCYDGIDNDCNGHVDCDDPACTAGSECVPDSVGWALGTTVAQGAVCPTFFTKSNTSINQGLNSYTGNACTGCTCTGSIQCQARLQHFNACGTAPACGGSADDGSGTLVDNINCVGSGFSGTSVTDRFASIAVTSGQTDYVKTTQACNASLNNATKPAATWDTQTKFCEVNVKGGGCLPGNVCLPKAAVGNHCALSAGNVLCKSGYAPSGLGANFPWFTDIDDTGRACNPVACACTNSNDGNCDTTHARMNLFSENTCTSAAQGLIQANGTQQCGNMTGSCASGTGSYDFAKLKWSGSGAVGPTNPSCGNTAVANTVTGTAVGSGAETICCR